MSVRRVGCLAAIVVATVLWISCGEVYRPVVIPIANNPPNPANFHSVFSINANSVANPGSAVQIDVSGDSQIGAATLGINPTHATMQAIGNGSRIFVTSAGSVQGGGADVVTSFIPASAGSTGAGIGNAVTFTLPNVGANQSSAITAISESGSVVTVTLASPIASATVGGPIVISGVVIPGGGQNSGAYNGNFTISAISRNTIQYSDCVNTLNPPQCATGLSSAAGGTASVPIPTFCSYQPDFVSTTQTSAVYVANYGVETPPSGSGLTPNPTPYCGLPSTDSVAALNTNTNTISQIAYLPPASHPVLIAETPDGQNLFVVNQGCQPVANVSYCNSTSTSVPASVVNLSTVDLSTTATIPLGQNLNPSWIAMRLDGQRLYLVTQGDGLAVPPQLFTIATDTNTVVSTQTVGSVGAAPNYILYDSNLNRLYVTSAGTAANPAGLVYVFSATSDPPAALPTPAPNPPGTLAIPAAPPCAAAGSACGPITPMSVAALPDGSRFYVASYQTQSPCSDPNAGAGSCIIPMVTVFDTKSLTIRSASSSYFRTELSLLSSPPFASGTSSTPPQYAIREVAACAPAASYSPSSATRFRLFATAAPDSSHVYVSICDAAAIADITTGTNTVSQGSNEQDRLVIDLLPPFSAGAVGPNNQPLPQSPVFLLSGR